MIAQILIAAFLLLIALLILLLVRQLALLRKRIGDGPTSVQQPLVTGDPIPVITVMTWQGNALRLDDGVERILFFAAFSCARCRNVLSQLPAIEASRRNRVVLMCLDAQAATHFAEDVAAWHPKDLPAVDAVAFAEAFHIKETPFAYHIDAEGRIATSALMTGPEAMHAFIRRLPTAIARPTS